MEENIPYSYRFERDLDMVDLDARSDNLIFSEDANKHFIYTNAKDLVETLEGRAELAKMVRQFTTDQKERLDTLDRYSKGDNANILAGRRRIEKNKSDYRIRHNWGGYISGFITGYVISNPVTIGFEGTDDDQGTNDLGDVAEINTYNDVDALNYELAYDASRFGRAFEFHYRDERNEDRIVLIDPREMFVVRDNTVEQRVIAAAHCVTYGEKLHITVYTDTHVITYEPVTGDTVSLTETGRKEHFYDDVPVVEWWNNRFRMGDFEPVIPQLDAYDSAQSDTANYMSDLNDAALLIKGHINRKELSTDDLIRMKEANMIIVESGFDGQGKQTNVDAGYIYKQYDVAGTEAYKQRLINDIYKLSHVPNLDDDRFYSGQSGVALQYKMIGLEQIRAIKETLFSRALRRRYQLIENVHRNLHDVEIDAKKLTFVFHENIPQDVWSEVDRFIAAGGDVSQQTLLEMASFIPGAATEQSRLKEENPSTTDYEKSIDHDDER